MVENDPNTQGSGSQEPIPYVTAEMAWEMSKRAAAEAREEALRESQSQQRQQSQQWPQSQQQPQAQQQSQQNNMGTQGNRDIQYDRDDYDDRRSRKRRRRDDYEDTGEEEDLIGFSPKLVKQLQTTVGVFNTLKDFASNPMQKAIEDRIGGLAAGIIEQAFTSPRGPPPKRDMVDTLLNSQMAFGLGQGLGSRAPELVESLSKSFGREKAENMIEGMIGKYSGGESRKIEPAERERQSSPEPSRQSPGPQKSEDQSNIELLLSLDPNNAEHVAAYSESQGGISIDVARKMLMIHQDDIIKRMKSQGADTTIIESQRGSRIGQDNPSQQSTSGSVHKVDVSPNYHNGTQQHTPVQPVQQPHPVQQHTPIQPVQQHTPIQQPPVQPISDSHPPIQQESDVQNDMQYIEPEMEDVPSFQKPGQEYAEYKDIGQQGQQRGNVKNNDANIGSSNSQQAEMMKTFADDIGKVMGDMINKIETLNNSVFTLQNELNEVKRQKVQNFQDQQLGNVPHQEERVQDLHRENEQRYTSTKDFFPETDNDDNLDTWPKEDTVLVPNSSQPEKAEDTERFFPEKVHNAHDFARELEEETKRASQLIRKEDAVDSEEKEDKEDKEVEIIKKPAMSMVNKKKVTYSLKQKEVGTQPEDIKNNEGGKDVKNNEDSKDIKNNEGG